MSPQSFSPSQKLRQLLEFKFGVNGYMQHVEQYRKDNEKKEQMEKKKVNLSIQKSPQPPSKLSFVINDEPKTAEAAPVLSLGP